MNKHESEPMSTEVRKLAKLAVSAALVHRMVEHQDLEILVNDTPDNVDRYTSFVTGLASTLADMLLERSGL